MSEVVTIEIDKLYEPYFNPRKHPQEQLYNLSESLREFGQRRTISVWPDGKGKYEILAGNGIRKAAELAKLKTLDCTIAPKEWDEVRRKAYALADNQGGYEDDMVKVAQILEEVRASGEIALEALGSSNDKLDQLLEELANQALQDAKPGLGGDEFEIPGELEPKAKFGDVWQLGKHRLFVGDSTNIEQVRFFMQGKQLDMIYTDPPYGVGYADKNRYLNAVGRGNSIQVPIENDHESVEDMSEFWLAAFQNLFEVSKPGCVYYASAPQGGELMMMMMMIEKAGWLLKHSLIWVKNNHVLGRADYAYKHEPILYGWKEGAGHKYYGGFQTSVFEVDKPLKNDLHPTMKPVALVEKFIENSSLPGELVGDWFLGSGTTMIACERLGRVCYGIEKNEHYASVIIKRWEMETGLGAQLLSSIELAGVTNG